MAVGKAPEQLEHENLGQEGAVEGENVRTCPLWESRASAHGWDGVGDRNWTGVRYQRATWLSCPHCTPSLAPSTPGNLSRGQDSRCAEEAEEEFSSPGAAGAMKDQETHYLGMYALDSLTNQKRLFIPLSFPRSLPSSWQVIHALI